MVSLNNDRPSLKVKFNEYKKKQDPIKGVSRLTLNNNNQDPARVLQYINYKLFNETGTVAPRCGFAAVTVNGKYLGLYSNVESIKSQFLERGFGDGSGALYEGTTTDFFPEWIGRMEKKNKAANDELLAELVTMINQDSIDLKELEQVLDVDAFIKFWAMESLLGFWDGYCSNQNNYFLYKNPENNKFYFIPWGADASLTKMTPLPPFRILPASVHSKAIIPNRLYRIPEIQEKYIATVNDFLDNHWNEEQLSDELDRVKELLGEHVMEDNRRFRATISSYRRFIKSRKKDLQKELADGPPELKSKEKTPVYFKEIGEISVDFSTKWYEVTPKKTSGLGEATINLTLNGEPVELENVGVYSELSKMPSMTGDVPASIVIVGNRKSDGKHLTFGTGVSQEIFKTKTGEEVGMNGILVEDRNFFNFQNMTMVAGTANLEKSSMTDGEPVVGSMKMKIIKMEGGKSVDETEEE